MRQLGGAGSPRSGARALALGRAAFGAALLIVPERVAKGWLGEYAERPAVQALVRSIGVRDLVLGMIALHTLDHPEVGPRWQATCAIVDTVDLLATGAARNGSAGGGCRRHRGGGRWRGGRGLLLRACVEAELSS